MLIALTHSPALGPVLLHAGLRLALPEPEHQPTSCFDCTHARETHCSLGHQPQCVHERWPNRSFSVAWWCACGSYEKRTSWPGRAGEE